MTTIYDQQSGKLLKGTVVNVNEFSFDLEVDGVIVGRFPVDNLNVNLGDAENIPSQKEVKADS